MSDPVVTLISQLGVASRDQALAHLRRTRTADAGVPTIYRVSAGRWQCEWDDLPTVGAFRSRWLGCAVHRAQVARLQFLIELLEDSCTSST